MNILNKLLHFFVLQFFLYEGEPGGGGEGGAGGEGGEGGGKSALTGEPGGGGGGTGAWYEGIEGLAPELQGSEFVRESPDLNTFIKRAVDTKKMVGANTIRIPGENATDEERADFLNKLGRPEAPDNYIQSEGVTLDDGIFLKDEFDTMMSGAKELFHNEGLTSKQATAILDWYMTTLNGQNKAQGEATQAQYAEQETALKDKYGNEYPIMLDAARSVVKQYGSDELVSWLEDTKVNGVALGNTPAFVELFGKIGKAMLDDDAGSAGSGLGQFMSDSNQALAEIENLKIDQSFMKVLTNEMDPGHRAAVERWRLLHEKAHGKGTVKAS